MENIKSNAIPKVNLPNQSGSLGSRTALELVRNSRLRSSCPVSISSPENESGSKPLTVASFMAMKNGNRIGKPHCHGSVSPQMSSRTSRKAVIPITSKQTSRVLNNLNVDCVAADIRIDDFQPPQRFQNSSENISYKTYASNSDQSSSVTKCQVHALSNSSTDSDGMYKNWNNLRSKLSHSISSFDSTVSEEDIPIWIQKN